MLTPSISIGQEAPTRDRRSSTLRLVVVGAVFAALSVLAGPAQPAAAEPALSVSPATGLNPERDFVTVTGTGFVPNSELFLMQCRSTSAEDHTCNSVGLQKVTADGEGNFTYGGLRVTARFGATDCTVTPCAVKTSAVEGHSGDRSQDRLARITFADPSSTAPPVTTPQPPRTTVPAEPVTPTTEAPVTTTTEAEATTTTTTEAEATTTTTEAEATTTTTEAEATTTTTEALATGDDDGDDGGSSALPIVLGVLVVAALGAGGALLVRRQRAGAA